MNEQIKELVKQAGLNIDGYGYPIWGCLDGADEKKEFLEKFAELIVKKCAKVAWCNTPDTEELDYGDLISSKIKEHFGIEE